MKPRARDIELSWGPEGDEEAPHRFDPAFGRELGPKVDRQAEGY
jgi:hypothetical protein